MKTRPWSCPTLARGIALGFTSLGLMTSPAAYAQEANTPQLPLMTQEVQALFPEEAHALAATFELLPLPGNRPLSAAVRWEAGNAEEAEAFAAQLNEHDLPGAWYLQPRHMGPPLVEAGQQWHGAGHDLGSKGLQDAFLSRLSRNRVFEVLASSRIELEAALDLPITSFSFPYDSVASPENRVFYEDLADMLARAGYHHVCAPAELAGFLSPAIPMSYAVPVDGEEALQNAVRELAGLDPPFRGQPGVLVTGSPAPDGGLGALAGAFDTMGAWRAVPNEYASYRLQHHFTTMSASEPAGRGANVVLERPEPQALPAAAALAFEISGTPPGTLEQVRISEGKASIDPVAADDPHAAMRFRVDLPFEPPAPEKIDAVHNRTNAPHPPDGPMFQDFRGVEAWLTMDEGRLSLRIENRSGMAMEDIAVTFRLPLGWEHDIRERWIPPLDRGSAWTEVWPPEKLPVDQIYFMGEAYFAAQIDFTQHEKPGRIYAACTVPLPKDNALPKGRAAILGPIPKAAFSEETFAAIAASETPWGQKWVLSESDALDWRIRNTDGAIPQAHLSPEVVRTAGAWEVEERGVYLIGALLTSPQKQPVVLLCEHHYVPQAYLNGEPMEDYSGELREGNNVLVVAYDVYTEGPAAAHAGCFLRLASPETGGRLLDIRYLLNPR